MCFVQAWPEPHVVESRVEWTDKAIVLGVRPHGENGVIADVLTVHYGRHLGLVPGGNSRSKRPILQPGNVLRMHWRARLSEHLGQYLPEMDVPLAAMLMEDRDALLGLNAVCAVLCGTLPERQPMPHVFAATAILLETMAATGISGWGALYVRWELGVLEALGFGLDLARCAVTGECDDLRFVSPRSGRAVSGSAGAPYCERLLALPPFLLGAQNPLQAGDTGQGMRLTGYFLDERVFHVGGKGVPNARLRLQERVAQLSL